MDPGEFLLSVTQLHPQPTLLMTSPGLQPYQGQQEQNLVPGSCYALRK